MRASFIFLGDGRAKPRYFCNRWPLQLCTEPLGLRVMRAPYSTSLTRELVNLCTQTSFRVRTPAGKLRASCHQVESQQRTAGRTLTYLPHRIHHLASSRHILHAIIVFNEVENSPRMAINITELLMGSPSVCIDRTGHIRCSLRRRRDNKFKISNF